MQSTVQHVLLQNSCKCSTMHMLDVISCVQGIALREQRRSISCAIMHHALLYNCQVAQACIFRKQVIQLVCRAYCIAYCIARHVDTPGLTPHLHPIVHEHVHHALSSCAGMCTITAPAGAVGPRSTPGTCRLALYMPARPANRCTWTPPTS